MYTAPSFPGFKIYGVKSPTPIVDQKIEAINKIRGHFSVCWHKKKLPRSESMIKWEKDQTDDIGLGRRFSIKYGSSSGYAVSERLANELYSSMDLVYSNTTVLATVEHENWHEVMAQVESKYNQKIRHRLADRVVNQLTVKSFQFMKWHEGLVAIKYGNCSLFKEEVLALLLDLANDRSIRTLHFGQLKFRKNLWTNIEKLIMKQFYSVLKQFRRICKTIKLEDLND